MGEKEFHETATGKNGLKCTKAGLLLAGIVIVAAGILAAVYRYHKGDAETLTVSGFAFDTTYTITLYEGGNQKVLNHCISKCSEYERIFSRTAENSELYQINELSLLYEEAVQNGEQSPADYIRENCSENNPADFVIGQDGSFSVNISEKMFQILKKGLYYCEQSGGAFDITIAPLTSLWDFSGENSAVPDEALLEEARKKVDYQNLSLTTDHTEQDKKSLCFSVPGMEIDLGGIAKGYIADALKNYLEKQGVTSGVINLGGNVLCIGSKEQDKPFQIGIQQPFADRNETVAVVKVQDISVVSSGIYERFFEQDGVLYHHILDPETGYSYQNDLMAVTILSEKSVDGDGLSTTCFSLGREKGLEYIDSLDGVYAMFITRDEKVWYSDGFEAFLAEE
ncbi:MAG: FAD:protein FMN transferase [Clostridiaceae bacterium]|nr:FAD:protein FMN transferase [Clostridiaceae bacterium]